MGLIWLPTLAGSGDLAVAPHLGWLRRYVKLSVFNYTDDFDPRALAFDILAEVDRYERAILFGSSMGSLLVLRALERATPEQLAKISVVADSGFTAHYEVVAPVELGLRVFHGPLARYPVVRTINFFNDHRWPIPIEVADGDTRKAVLARQRELRHFMAAVPGPLRRAQLQFIADASGTLNVYPTVQSVYLQAALNRSRNDGILRPSAAGGWIRALPATKTFATPRRHAVTIEQAGRFRVTMEDDVFPHLGVKPVMI